MIPAYLAIFVIMWTTLAVLGAVLLGAFVAYCKQKEANPLTQLRSGFFVPPEEFSETRKREEQPGFYE